MGYPTEIPNRIPPRRDVPVRGAWGRLLDRVVRIFAIFTRRPRRRADAPERYGQGVDRSLPPLTAADAKRLDPDQLTSERRA